MNNQLKKVVRIGQICMKGQYLWNKIVEGDIAKLKICTNESKSLKNNWKKQQTAVVSSLKPINKHNKSPKALNKSNKATTKLHKVSKLNNVQNN